jgi:hypothetical protein
VPLAQAGHDGGESPFILSLVDEKYDGVALYVAGTVAGAFPVGSLVEKWEPSRVALRVRVLQNTQELTKVARLVSEFTPQPFVKNNERVPFAFVIPVENFSTYLVDLVWGDEARRITAPQVLVKVTELATEQISCNCPPCPVYPLIKLEATKIGGNSKITSFEVSFTADWLDKEIRVRLPGKLISEKKGFSEQGLEADSTVYYSARIPVPFFPEDLPSHWNGAVSVSGVLVDY